MQKEQQYLKISRSSDLLVRTLKVKRKHRNIAANLASNVNLYLSELKLKELDGDLE